jgi:uncharacterized protein (TIGR02757 family)
MDEALRIFLDKKVDEYDQPFFIAADPVCIPHMFSKKQDIEIAGFFAAMFAWGNRTTIINKSKELMGLMENAPHEFVLHHEEADLRRLLDFKHRTFNATDLLYFIEFFRMHYRQYPSLEDAFTKDQPPAEFTVEHALNNFYQYFFSLEDAPARTRKHVSAPWKKSTCKRLNMFLRWMVRKNSAVDFGIWNTFHPSMLLIPLDLHVSRVARQFGLIDRPSTDWQTVIELTQVLRSIDPDDPVKYDYALFGLGVLERFT